MEGFNELQKKVTTAIKRQFERGKLKKEEYRRYCPLSHDEDVVELFTKILAEEQVRDNTKVLNWSDIEYRLVKPEKMGRGWQQSLRN